MRGAGSASGTGSEPGREEVLAELARAQEDLADLLELRSGFLGQTGVHIGMRVLTSARRQFEQEEARLKKRMALLERLLHAR